MPADILEAAITIAKRADEDYYAKQDWYRKGTAVLRRLARDLALEKGSFDIRFNAGGPAVSGEAILHSDATYVALCPLENMAGIARKVKSRKDYTGGRNILIPVCYVDLLRIAQEIS